MGDVDLKVLAPIILAELLGDVKSNIHMISCSGDNSQIKTKLQRGMEFYAALAKELNNILKEKAPEFIFRGDIDAQLAGICALENAPLENALLENAPLENALLENAPLKNAPLLLNNMKGGMPAGNGKDAFSRQAGPGRQFVPYDAPNGKQTLMSVFNPGVVSKKHGYQASMLAELAIEAAKQGNLAEALRFTSKIDRIVKTQELLDLGLPLASINQHLAGGFALGGLIGVALFYLLSASLIIIPAGLSAGTAQYATNVVANTTRSGLNIFSWGFISKNVAQPDVTDTAKTVANNIQQFLESVITDKIAGAFIFLCMVGCMCAAGLYARYLNNSIMNARQQLEDKLRVARNQVNQELELKLEHQRQIQLERQARELQMIRNAKNNRATLGLNPGGQLTGPEITEAYKRKARFIHPNKGGDTGLFQKLQEAYDALMKKGGGRRTANRGLKRKSSRSRRTTKKSHRGGSGLRGH
jgi:hypothetical protein